MFHVKHSPPYYASPDLTGKKGKQRMKAQYTVDYLTLTAGMKDTANRLISAAIDICLSDQGTLPPQTPWQFQGYRGYHSEGFNYGTNNKGGGIVQLWGANANQAYRELHGHHSNCPRIDLAVTVTLDSPDLFAAGKAYNSQGVGKKHKATMILNNRGGATTYLGSRQSRYYGRIYDKGSQLGKQPGMIWRYEVEVKKPASNIVYDQLFLTKNPQPWIASAVHDFYTGRGVELPWTPTIPHDAIEIGRNLTSEEIKLQWLEKQIQPTIRRLIDAGLGEQAKIALGFSPMTRTDWINPEEDN